METLAAAVCTVYGFGYSGYYLANLTRHLTHVFRGADPKSTELTAESPLAPSAPGEEAKEEQNDHNPPAVVTPQPELSKTLLLEKEHEQIALSEMPCQTRGELFPAREQLEQLRQQVEEPQENGQDIKAEPQAELPKAQSDIKAVKRRHEEDIRRIQEHWNLHRQRGNLQNQVSGRVAATPLMKLALACSSQKVEDSLQAELQTNKARIKPREKRLEEGMKIIKEPNHLLQEKEVLQKRVEVLTSHLAACEDFQQVIGHKEPQGWREAQDLSQPEVLKAEHILKMVVEKRIQWEEIYTGSVTEPAAAAASSKGAFAPQPEKWSPGSLLSSSVVTAAQQQENEDKYLELLRKMVSMENPVTKYIELENIGSGTFGEVCRALDTATGGEVAIKKINLQGPRRKEVTGNELMVMKMNKNPNTVNYLDSYLVDEELWLVMEYMDGDTLSDVISKTYLCEDEMATISRECLKGLDFLHSNHMIHQHVKSCNILLGTHGSVKLADFGLSAQLTPEQSRQRSVAGISGWMAPEIVTGQPYGPKADIWSFGIVGIEMVEREVPHWNGDPVSPQLLIATGGRPKLQEPNLFSPLLRGFLSCCLQTNEERRWSAKELLQHPFVASAEPVSSLVPLIIAVKKRKEETRM
ncbi:serine/threonine-protein kinase PAK 3-like [Aphelocoma coerulescens]|uniref:serine/threonine-protein kinase PAK 3-like n=1 Tax=Aphelocoma coerulescens TaxID=39617 RepID=UPI00360510F8